MIKIEMSLEVKDLWSLLYLAADALSRHAPLPCDPFTAEVTPAVITSPEQTVTCSKDETPKQGEPEEVQAGTAEGKKPAKKASGKKAALKKEAAPEETENALAETEVTQVPEAEAEHGTATDQKPAATKPQEEKSDVITVEATAEGIKRAGAMLIDKDRAMMQPLMAVLKKFGVQAITQLKPEQYEGVAEEICGLLAQVSGKDEVE